MDITTLLMSLIPSAAIGYFGFRQWQHGMAKAKMLSIPPDYDDEDDDFYF